MNGSSKHTRSTSIDITARRPAEELIRAQRDLALALGSVYDLEATLDICLKGAVRIAGMDCGGLYLVDETSGDINLICHQGLPSGFSKRATRYDADSPQARLIMAGSPIYTNYENLGVPRDEVCSCEELHAIAIVPVHHEDRVLACLNVASHTLNEVPECVRTALESITAQIGNAIARAKAEETLRKHQEQLEELVEQRSAELARKNNELEQIVYATSHDLRSPMITVQGFSKELKHALQELRALLQREGIPEDVKEKATSIIEKDIQEDLKYIFTGIEKMETLLSGLLLLSRLGRAALTIMTLDMNRLMSEVLTTMEFQIQEAGITLDVSELPPCQGDTRQINQVFSNLLGNALKFLDPSRPGTIRILGSARGDQAIYCVEDNGIGIAPEHQKHIFEIFQQLHPSENSGEGLGLTIVRKILERHHGKIWVESEVAKGSKFYISLPGA